MSKLTRGSTVRGKRSTVTDSNLTTLPAPPTYGAANRIENEQRVVGASQAQQEQQVENNQSISFMTPAITSIVVETQPTPIESLSSTLETPMTSASSLMNATVNPQNQDMFTLMNQMWQFMQTKTKREEINLDVKLFGKLRRFTGDKSEDFDEWLEDFEAKIATQKCSDIDKVVILRSHLDGGARATFSGFGPYEKSSYTNVVKALREIYTKKHSIEYVHDLRNLKKLSEESCETFAGRIRKITNRAYPNSPIEEREKTVIDYFINGLEAELREIVAAHKPLTVSDAIELAYRHEKLININVKNEKKRKISTLMVSKDESEADSSVESESMPKRNGGTQKITLCSIAQQMNNNNKQLISSNKDFHQKINQRLDELENKVNYNEYRSGNSNSASNYRNNRNHPYHMQGKFTGFTNNRSHNGNNLSKSCYTCGANDHLRVTCPHNSKSNSNFHSNTFNKELANSSNKSIKNNRFVKRNLN